MQQKNKKESREDMEKFRARNFNLVLYPNEDITHKKALEYIQKNYDYALIYHNKDTDSYGEIKKEHVHVVLRFVNAKWNTSIAEELKIEPNYIQECRSLKRSLLYLIHFYDEDKYQYDVKNVKGSLTKKLYEILTNQDKTENEKMQDLITYIDGLDTEINISQFIRYCVSIGYTDIIRRNFAIIKPLIDEHNIYFRRNLKDE